jgi:hypothetical protein
MSMRSLFIASFWLKSVASGTTTIEEIEEPASGDGAVVETRL